MTNLSKNKRVQPQGTQSGNLHRFGKVVRTSKVFKNPDPGDPTSPVWRLCPPIVDELANKILAQFPLHTPKQVLGLVREALDTIEPAESEKVDFIEVCAGCANAIIELRKKGKKGWAFDIKFSSSHDLLIVKGLLNIGYHAKCVKPGGLGILAPVCSSWPRASAASGKIT